MIKIAIIGAGVAGLACGDQLAGQGFNITVFEKSRGLGGRLATRRTDYGAFDHGAQYITARDEAFQSFLERAEKSSHSALWQAGCNFKNEPVYTGMPFMNRLVTPLCTHENLTLMRQTEIASLLYDADNLIYLTAKDHQTHGPFDHVVISAPAPQAMRLLTPLDEAFQTLAKITCAPCWTLLAAFESPLPLEAITLSDHSSIGWIAHNNTKPERSTPYACYTVHMNEQASLIHLDHSKEDMTRLMLEDLKDVVGADLPPALYAASHRWLYAKVTRSLQQDYVMNKARTLSYCGDGCLGPRVEWAYLSGFRLGQFLRDCF
jgi:renalase